MLRSTRQYIEALVIGPGDLRVSRQYVEVLVKAPNFVNEGIEFSQVIVVEAPLMRTVSQTIDFYDYEWEFPETSNVRPATNAIEFEQEVEISGLLQFVYQNIEFTQSVAKVRPWYIDVAQAILVSQWPEVGYAVRHIDVDDSLTITDAFRKGIEEPDLVQGFEFEQDLARVLMGPQAVVFAHRATAGKGYTASQRMTFEDSVVVKVVYKRLVTQDLDVGQSFTFQCEYACGTRSFTPWIGAGADDNPDVSNYNLPLHQFASELVLAYPSLGVVTDSVSLRSPELDDIERVSYDRVFTETRGGVRVMYADPAWPKVSTLGITILGLSVTDVTDLQTFLAAYLGKEIRLTDWTGVAWVGIITTPDAEIVMDGKRGYTVVLEFEGARVESYVMAHLLEFSQDSDAWREVLPFVTDAMNFSQGYFTQIGVQRMAQPLEFSQEVLMQVSVQHLYQVLGISQGVVAWREISHSVADTMSISQEIFTQIGVQRMAHSLDISQDIFTQVSVQRIAQALEFSQGAVATSDLPDTATNAISFSQDTVTRVV